MTVEAVNMKTGEKKVYRAQYAVGCDGGKSFVRKSLGTKIFYLTLNHTTLSCNSCSRSIADESC